MNAIEISKSKYDMNVIEMINRKKVRGNPITRFQHISIPVLFLELVNLIVMRVEFIYKDKANIILHVSPLFISCKQMSNI